MDWLLALFPLNLSDELSVYQPINYVRARRRRAKQTDFICRLVPQKSLPIEGLLSRSQRCLSLSKDHLFSDHLCFLFLNPFLWSRYQTTCPYNCGKKERNEIPLLSINISYHIDRNVVKKNHNIIIQFISIYIKGFGYSIRFFTN